MDGHADERQRDGRAGEIEPACGIKKQHDELMRGTPSSSGSCSFSLACAGNISDLGSIPSKESGVPCPLALSNEKGSAMRSHQMRLFSYPFPSLSLGGGEKTMFGTAQCNEPAAPALMIFFLTSSPRWWSVWLWRWVYVCPGRRYHSRTRICASLVVCLPGVLML